MIRKGFQLLISGAIVTMLATAVLADQAVVVGVNEYANLPSANLNGCVNDAKVMGDTLNKYGFKVTLITDKQATKGGITTAIKQVGGKMDKSERFVFYFAGHGTTAADGGNDILPADALKNAETNDMGADELNTLVKTITAKSHTVVLDSCFSGGMMRSFKGLSTGRPSMRTRYYARPGMGSRAVVANSKDLVLADDKKTDTNGVCYFAAARGNEQAGEDKFDNTVHGVFTYYFSKVATGQKDRWADVHAKVSQNVATYMEDTQHPMISADYISNTIFDDGDVKPEPHTLWDVYNGDNTDPNRIKLLVQPDKTTFTISEKLKFEARVGQGGYLVLIERGTSGKINLLFPRNKQADDAQVKAGQIIRIPESGKAFAPDTVGNERIKGILFNSKEAAAELLKQFPDGQGRGRDLNLVDTGDDTNPGFYTSDVIFEVTK